MKPLNIGSSSTYNQSANVLMINVLFYLLAFDYMLSGNPSNYLQLELWSNMQMGNKENFRWHPWGGYNTLATVRVDGGCRPWYRVILINA